MPDSVQNQNPNVSRSVSVANFRELVNYDNTTNKGYVRFVSAGNGGFKVEKFNNKVDIPLWMCFKTSAKHNKEVRMRLVDALERDFRFLEKGEVDALKNLILRPKASAAAKDGAKPKVLPKTKEAVRAQNVAESKGVFDGVGKEKPAEAVDVEGKALSRRELRDILKEFDKSFNTFKGRCGIMDRIFETAMKKTGAAKYQSLANKQDFIDKFLKPYDRNFDFSGVDYLESDDGGRGAIDDSGKSHMIKGEKEFRAYITQLESKMDDAIQCAQAEEKCVALGMSAAKSKSSFGLSLMGDEYNGVRAALLRRLNAEGVDDPGLGPNNRGTGLSLFMRSVLPAMVQQAVENVRIMDEDDMKDDAKVRAAISEVVNIGNIAETAKKFIAGVNETIKTSMQAEEPVGAKQDSNVGKMDGKTTTNRMLTLFIYTKRELTENVFVRGNDLTNLAQISGAGAEEFKTGLDLENYAYSFISKNFAKGIENGEVKRAKPFNEAVKSYVDKVVIGAELARGGLERKEGLADGKKYLATYEGGTFATHLSNHVLDRAAEMKLEDVAVDGLHVMISNIIDRKTENALASNGETKLKLNNESLEAAAQKLDDAMHAYVAFVEGSGKFSARAAMSAVEKRLSRMVDGKMMTKEQAKLFQEHHAEGLLKAQDRAVERFFQMMPMDKVAEGGSKAAVANCVKLLEDLFAEEKEVEAGKMRRSLNIITVAYRSGPETCQALLDSAAHVDNFLKSLESDTTVAKTFKENYSESDLVKVLDRLYYQTLEGMVKPDSKELSESIIKKVDDQFAKKAKSLISRLNAFSDSFDKSLLQSVKGGVDTTLKIKEQFDLYKKGLTKDRYSEMATSMSENVILALKDDIGNAKRRYLLVDESARKGLDPEKMALDLFGKVDKDSVYTKKNIAYVYETVFSNREKAVMTWVKDETGNAFNADTLEKISTAAQKKLGGENVLSESERYYFAHSYSVKALDHAVKFSQSYASGNKADFIKRVTKEVEDEVATRGADFIKGRIEAAKTSDNLIPKYLRAIVLSIKQEEMRKEEKLQKLGDTLKLQEAPEQEKGSDSVKTAQKAESKAESGEAQGKEHRLARAREKALDERLSTDLKNDPRMEAAKKKAETAKNTLLEKFAKGECTDWLKFEDMLTAELDKIVTEAGAKEAKETLMRFETAYDKCMPVFRDKIKEGEKRLREAGLGDAEIKFMNDKLLRVMESDFQSQILKNASLYTDVYGKEAAGQWGDSYITDIVRELDDLAFTNPKDKEDLNPFRMFIAGLGGYQPLSDNDDACKYAMKSLEDAFKTQRGQEVYAKAKLAAIARPVYKESNDALFNDATAALQEFRDFANDILIGHLSAALYLAINKSAIPKAKELFRHWLAQYNLPPNFTVDADKYGKFLFTDVAMNMLEERIAEFPQDMIKSGVPDEPLLNDAFLLKFQSFLRKSVVSKLLGLKNSSKSQEAHDKVINDPANVGIYQIGSDPLTDLALVGVKKVNAEDLGAAINIATDRAATAVAKKLTMTVESVNRFAKDIDESYDREVKSVETLVDRCNTLAHVRVDALNEVKKLADPKNDGLKVYLSNAIASFYSKKQNRTVTLITESLAQFQKTTDLLASKLAARLKMRLEKDIPAPVLPSNDKEVKEFVKLSDTQVQTIIEDRIKLLGKDGIKEMIAADALAVVAELDGIHKSGLHIMSPQDYDEAHALRKWIEERYPKAETNNVAAK